MTRMFQIDGKTVKTINPIHGECQHRCRYCYVKSSRAKRFYQGEPTFYPGSLRSIGKNNYVFVGSMHDIWGDWVDAKVLDSILTWCIQQDPSNIFMFLTKNPGRYLRFLNQYPIYKYYSNLIFGATIESNYLYLDTKSPQPWHRAAAMSELKRTTPVKTFISIEPVMAFCFEDMFEMVMLIKPNVVFIGFDNHGHNLREPTQFTVDLFIHELEVHGIKVIRKTMRDTNLNDNVSHAGTRGVEQG